MNEEYILYVKKTCPFCIKAEKLLLDNGMVGQIKIVPFDEQIPALEHMKWAYSHKTVPMIFHRTGRNMIFVGGYSDLISYLEERDGEAQEELVS